LLLTPLNDQAESATLPWASFLPLWLFEPATPAYRRILETRPLHLITNWSWYEWLRVFAPLLLLLWFGRLAQARGRLRLRVMCRALIGFQIIFLLTALVIARPGRFELLSELQPMRSLHLLYLLLFLFMGGWLGMFVLRTHAWRWVLMFAPLC